MPRNQHKPKIEEKLQTLANLLPLSKFGMRAIVEIAPSDSKPSETYLLEYGRLGLCFPDIYQMVDCLRSAGLIVGEEHHEPSDAISANKEIKSSRQIYIGDNLSVKINDTGSLELEFVPIGSPKKIIASLDDTIKNIQQKLTPDINHKNEWRLHLETEKILRYNTNKYRTV